MTKEKQASLRKYIADLSHKLTAPISEKHAKRGSHKELKAFLTLEIARTKATLDSGDTALSK